MELEWAAGTIEQTLDEERETVAVEFKPLLVQTGTDADGVTAEQRIDKAIEEHRAHGGPNYAVKASREVGPWKLVP